MSNSQLLEASFVDGLRIPHYMNGRLLNAEDLRAEQTAQFARLGFLGQAVGGGIVHGLMAMQAGVSSMQVTAGMGINGQGTVLRLPGDITLNLSPSSTTVQPADDAGRFRRCDLGAPDGASAPLTDGAYLLTALPATQLEGQAPLKSATGGTLPSGCTSRWEVDGLRFKTIRLIGFGSGGIGATSKNRRSLLAHWCFGSDQLPRLAVDPFVFGDDYGGLDQLSASDLTACDLPIAVFYWQGGKIAFVDAWPARRRPIRPAPLLSWQGFLADKRVADAQARFLQFQDQVDVLLSAKTAGSAKAVDYFRHLPPVGFLPVRPAAFLVEIIVADIVKAIADRPEAKETTDFTRNTVFTRAGPTVLSATAPTTDPIAQIQKLMPQTGFELMTFFGEALPADVVLIDGESVDHVLQQSWFDEAIDLTSEPRFDLYVVRDGWMRLVGKALLDYLAGQSPRVGLASSAVRQLQERVKAVLPAAVPGAEDLPYVMFVKQVREPVRVPIRSQPQPPKTGITGRIAVWHPYASGSAEGKVLNSLVAQAQKQHPDAQIEVTGFSAGELQERLLAGAAAGEAPDLVLANDDNLTNWVERGVVQPVDTWHTQDGEIADVAYAGVSLGDRIYGIPQSIAGVAMFFNRRTVPTPPATTGALREVARQARPAFVRAPYYAYGYYRAFGGQLLDGAGRCAATQAGFADAMNYFLELQKLGSRFASLDEAVASFQQGESQILFSGPWSLAALRTSLGSALGVAPMPAGPGGPARPLLTVESYFLTQASQNQENAVRLAELLTDLNAQTLYADQADRVPVRTTVAPADARLGDFTQALVAGTSWPQQPQFAAWWTPFQTMMDNVLANNANVQRAIEQACQEMDKANGF